jgi:hypothetical protein
MAGGGGWGERERSARLEEPRRRVRRKERGQDIPGQLTLPGGAGQMGELWLRIEIGDMIVVGTGRGGRSGTCSGRYGLRDERGTRATG